MPLKNYLNLLMFEKILNFFDFERLNFLGKQMLGVVNQ